MPKRKSVPKPQPDPRYVLGQLCYLDGTMQPRCRVCFGEVHSPECVLSQILTAATGVLRGFGQGVFVRDPSHDDEPDWADRALPYVMALARLEVALVHARATNAVDPSAQHSGTPTPRD